jgi:hypothetical protein
MDVILGPDDLVRLVLEQFFGRASLVVFMWVLITVAIGWIQLASQAARARTTIVKFFSSSHDNYNGRSAKVRATLQLTGIWIALYGIASIVTQIWAGSTFSPGQGGGLAELLTWSALFGLLTVVGTYIVLPAGYAHAGIFITPFVGYVVGLIYAVVTFTQKGGPQPGDWWVAPAASCCLVLVAASYARLRYAGRTRGEETA